MKPNKRPGLPTEEIYNLYQGGLSLSKIANMFKVNQTSIRYHVHKHERKLNEKA